MSANFPNGDKCQKLHRCGCTLTLNITNEHLHYTPGLGGLGQANHTHTLCSGVECLFVDHQPCSGSPLRLRLWGVLLFGVIDAASEELKGKGRGEGQGWEGQHDRERSGGE